MVTGEGEVNGTFLENYEIMGIYVLLFRENVRDYKDKS